VGKKMKNQISDGDCDGLLGYIMLGLEASKFAFLVHHHNIHKATIQSTEDHLSTQSYLLLYEHLYSIIFTEYNILTTRNQIRLHLQSPPLTQQKQFDKHIFQTHLKMSAAVLTRTAAKTVARRPVSFVMQIRNMGRAFEHAPYQRIPVTLKPATPDYVKEVSFVVGKIVT
jgi:hypothetical protein